MFGSQRSWEQARWWVELLLSFLPPSSSFLFRGRSYSHSLKVLTESSFSRLRFDYSNDLKGNLNLLRITTPSSGRTRARPGSRNSSPRSPYLRYLVLGSALSRPSRVFSVILSRERDGLRSGISREFGRFLSDILPPLFRCFSSPRAASTSLLPTDSLSGRLLLSVNLQLLPHPILLRPLPPRPPKLPLVARATDRSRQPGSNRIRQSAHRGVSRADPCEWSVGEVDGRRSVGEDDGDRGRECEGRSRREVGGDQDWVGEDSSGEWL